MLNNRRLWFLLLAMLLSLVVAACGGGGGDTTTPVENPDPGGGGPGGDDPDITPPGMSASAFTIPNGYTDLRGVASSMQYVYVADANTVYAFDKFGNFINQVAAPARIQAIACFPTTPDVENVDMDEYEFAGFPVILHDPVGSVGYLRIYGPNLDTLTTREDVNHPDGPKFLALPNVGDGIVPPDDQLTPPPPYVCIRVYDMTVDRFGSILVVADIDITGTPPYPDYNRALQIFNQFNGYAMEKPTSFVNDPDGPDGPQPPETFGDPCFAAEKGYACGDMGSIGIDKFFPFNRTDLQYTYYTGDFNLLRDFVGIAFITFSPFTELYEVSQSVNNSFGYTRIIGESVGSAPGSFNQNPPYDPDGNLEDPDLSNGGPSGIACDPMTDNVYICDPGNRRIQVFDPTTGAFIRQIGNGTRGQAGNSFLAPSGITVDYEGNMFVCDVNDLRLLREKQPGLHFGSVGGTVRRLDTLQPLTGASVSIGNEAGNLGAVATNINGDYIIRYLVTGTYYMTSTKFGYDSDTATVQILNDTTIRADFNLRPRTPATTGSYVGSIIDSVTNLPLPDVTVTVVGTSLTTVTDSLGRFLFTTMAPGMYQVVYSKEGYVTLTRDVEIIGGSTTADQLIQLVPLP